MNHLKTAALLVFNVLGIGSALALLVQWPLWTLLGAVVHVGVTHILFSAVMNYMRVRDAGHVFAPELRGPIYGAYGLGIALDVALNFLWTPLAGLRFVPAFTFSETLEVWALSGRGHRQRIGAFLRPRWLSPYDPSGKHGTVPSSSPTST